MMETFYMTKKQFWDWFNREAEAIEPVEKRMRTESFKPTITEAVTRCDARYIILYGRHKPGKKTKVWEGDGFLTMVGPMAHLCDLKGRMLEEPTVLDDVDYKSVEDLGEIMIGNTDVQIIELDKK